MRAMNVQPEPAAHHALLAAKPTLKAARRADGYDTIAYTRVCLAQRPIIDCPILHTGGRT